jgi:hypothetical protein
MPEKLALEAGVSGEEKVVKFDEIFSIRSERGRVQELNWSCAITCLSPAFQRCPPRTHDVHLGKLVSRPQDQRGWQTKEIFKSSKRIAKLKKSGI